MSTETKRPFWFLHHDCVDELFMRPRSELQGVLCLGCITRMRSATVPGHNLTIKRAAVKRNRFEAPPPDSTARASAVHIDLGFLINQTFDNLKLGGRLFFTTTHPNSTAVQNSLCLAPGKQPLMG